MNKFQPVRIIFMVLASMSLNACIMSWNEKGGSSFTSPLTLPVELGVAAYHVAKSSTLSIEFRRDSDCTRFAPLDSYRVMITRKNKEGETKVVVERYISKELEEFKFLEDLDGRYEATVFHQNQPEHVKRTSFTLGDVSKVISLKLPCLK